MKSIVPKSMEPIAPKSVELGRGRSDYDMQLKRYSDHTSAVYFKNAQGVISERLCLAAILVLDDCFCDRFGENSEERLPHYKRFAECLCSMFTDYKRDCYEWGGQWDDPHAIGKAMKAELKERGIEVNFQ